MQKKSAVRETPEKRMHATLELIKEVLLRANHKQPTAFHRFADQVREGVESTTKTPHITNMLAFVFSQRPNDVKTAKELFVRKCNHAQFLLQQNKEQVLRNVISKITKGVYILTHDETPELLDAVKHVTALGIAVNILMTESPFSETGKNCSKNFLKHAASVKFFPAAAARQAIKQADMVVLQAEAVTPTKVITKMGGELLAELASQRKIPVYAIATTWQMHKELALAALTGEEQSTTKQGSAKCEFEQINPALITGIISEKGTHAHNIFVELVEKERKARQRTTSF